MDRDLGPHLPAHKDKKVKIRAGWEIESIRDVGRRPVSLLTRSEEDEVEHQAHHRHPGIRGGAVVVGPRQLSRQLAGVAAADGGGPGIIVGGGQAGGVGHGVVQVDVAVAAVQVLAAVVAGSA